MIYVCIYLFIHVFIRFIYVIYWFIRFVDLIGLSIDLSIFFRCHMQFMPNDATAAAVAAGCRISY
jgi:hypothetical protein